MKLTSATCGNTSGLYLALSDAIKSGHIKNITKYTQELANQKEDPHKILNQILFQINQLFPIMIGIQNKLSHEALAKKLNKHPFYIKKLMATLSQNKSALNVKQAYKTLASIDKKIKTGKLSAKQGLLVFNASVTYQI